VDITNPVNETFDGLVTPPDSSAAQELASTAAGARVVKAFNTTFAGTLIEGRVAGQPLDVFIAGDDDDAKATVAPAPRISGTRCSRNVSMRPRDGEHVLSSTAMLPGMFRPPPPPRSEI
jgi:predicted dinucleotide-binding enzyme